MTVPELLIKYREAHKVPVKCKGAKQKYKVFTQAQAADVIGVHRKTYINYEAGISDISFEHMVKLFHHYGYTLHLSKPEYTITLTEKK